MGTEHETLLLIVEPEAQVRRALARLLRRHFDRVLVTETADGARGIIEGHPVSHLLCDEELVVALPGGERLVAAWRAVRPSLQRAVLLSGSDSSQTAIPAGVDGVLSKSADREEILAGLEGPPPA
jgi:DNA-binding NarL/FixJ family response regulator